MATAYKEALEFVQSNPIKDYTEGEDRVLRGFQDFSLSQEMANTGVWIWTLRRLKRIQERGLVNI